MDDAQREYLADLIDDDAAQAVARITELIEESPIPDPGLHYMRGAALYRLEDFRAAQDDMQVAISLDATNANSFYYLGASLERQGNRDDAIVAYRTAWGLNPQLTKARQKIQLLDPTSIEERPSTQPDKAPASPLAQSSLMLPNTDPEFEDFERRVSRRELIETRVRNTAQIAGMPWWGKALTIVVALFIVAKFVDFGYSYVTRPDPKDEAHRQYCQMAAENHQTPPGCPFP